MKRCFTCCVALVGLWLNTASAQSILETKLTASDGRGGDEFGLSVSISGEYALIGAPVADGRESRTGAAYVFKRDGTTWIEQTPLTASDGEFGDQFGCSVSISGDYALVGATGDGIGSGSAYIFKRDGTTWIEQAKLIPSDGNGVFFFGGSVSISGEYALVGAPISVGAGGPLVTAYVFKRDGTTWIEQTPLTPSDSQLAGSPFGNSVSISGEYALVGAPLASVSEFGAGAAYVFKRDGTTWIEQAKLTASDGEFGDEFGLSVSISGEYALVGAPEDDDKGHRSGSAYVYSDVTTVVAISTEEEGGLPKTFALHQNYPNPFNPETAIRFELPEMAAVRLVVYDVVGRQVRVLVDGSMAAGQHAVQFATRSLPSGLYLYRLETPAGSFTKQMLLVK